MKIKKLTAYLLMSGMILGTMSSDLYTIKAQAVETIEETEDKTPENETPQIPETPEQPETEPENEEVTEAAPVGEIELSAEQFPDQVILTFAGTCDKDGNGSLSEAECMEVEELAMPNAGITNLKGVENFRNLQRVDVSQNAIGDFTPVKDLSPRKLYIQTCRCSSSEYQPLLCKSLLQSLNLPHCSNGQAVPCPQMS